MRAAHGEPRKLTVRLVSDEVFRRPPERLRLAVRRYLRRRKRNARYRPGKQDERHRAGQACRAAGGAREQAAAAGAIAVRSRGRAGLLPLSLLQRCRRGRPLGFTSCGLGCGLALTVMNGCQVLMADMGPRDRRRKRKRDQDDRRSQNSHNLLLWHGALIVAQASVRYRGGTGNSRSFGEIDRRHTLGHYSPPFPARASWREPRCAIARHSLCFARPGITKNARQANHLNSCRAPLEKFFPATDDSGANGCIRCNHELVSTMRCAEKPQGLHHVIARFRDIRRMQEVAAAQSLLDSAVVFRASIGFAMMENLRRVAFVQQQSTLECVDRSLGPLIPQRN